MLKPATSRYELLTLDLDDARGMIRHDMSHEESSRAIRVQLQNKTNIVICPEK